MGDAPSFTSSLLLEMHAADVRTSVLRFEFVLRDKDGDKADEYVVSRFDIDAKRLLYLPPGTEAALTSDYHPGKLLVQLCAPASGTL